MQYHPKPAPKRKREGNDLKDDAVTQAGCDAMIKAMRPYVDNNPARLLKDFNATDIRGITVCVLSAAASKRSEIEIKEDLFDDEIPF